MHRIVLFHDDLNALGGAERVCLGFVEVAKEMGFETTLVTTVPPDWRRIRLTFGSVATPDRWESLFSGPRRLEKYDRLLMTSFAKRFRRGSVTINTAGYRWLPVKAEATYEHTPPVTLLTIPRSGVPLGKRVYYAPFDLLQVCLLRTGKTEVLTNSYYCASKLSFCCKSVQVLYPPVDLDRSTNSTGRDDIVVTCGRYEEAKNYGAVIRIASKLPTMKFVVMGTTSTSGAAKYLSRLSRLADDLHVPNVVFLRDVPRQSQINIYRTARVYLHTMMGEDFGIAAVEAMSSGLIPVVHKSGGLWEDVIRQGKFGFGYSNVDEAVQAIRIACRQSPAVEEEVVVRSREFGKDAFRREAAGFVRRFVGGEGSPN